MRRQRARVGGGRRIAVTALALLAVVFAALAVFAPNPGAAQEVHVELEPGPYYQGQPVQLHIVATQFEEEPAPEIEFDPTPGLSLAFLGVSPSSSTSITIINGQMTRVHEVSFTYKYELTSNRVGRISVPEFRVSQGSTQRRTQARILDVAALPSSDEIGIAVVLPEGPIFVGQKVPVRIELRIDQDVAPQILDYRVHVPLFEIEGLRFIDTKPAGANSQLQIVTPMGRLHLDAIQEERVVAGRPSVVLRAERTLVASKPGSLAVAAPTVAVERGTRFRQDLFGGRRAVQSQRMLGAGRPQKLEIAELPAQGRPPSFAGAVGSDFSLEVVADRSVVQLGEPIDLTFKVRGRGDLGTAGLPPLDAEGLFDPRLFRLPDEAPAGVVDGDGKRFRVTVRVLDARVREIPAIAYSYFDAGSRRFETVHSQPIALSVSAAQIVGADAVATGSDPASGGGPESSAGATPEASGAAKSTAQSADPGAAGGAEGGDARFGSLAERAANLAVERDPAILLGTTPVRANAGLIVFSFYGAGLALLGLGLVDRRRRAVDPALRARIAALSRCRQAIAAAVAPGHADAAGALGRALRELVAAEPTEASPELDAIVAECDALRFAPGAGTGTGTGGATAAGLPQSLATRATQLVAARITAVKRGPLASGLPSPGSPSRSGESGVSARRSR